MKLSGTLCETHFLGWDAPLLPRAVEFLRDEFGQDGSFDLSNLICVLPAARSTRRLASLLRWEAEEYEWEFWPPEIITVGELAERLYKPTAPIALDFEQTLAWSTVLRAKPPESLKPLLPTLPPADSVGAWLELAGTLRRLHADLSSNCLSFADVAAQAETDSEKRRWDLLDRLFQQYLDVLQQAGVVDPHWARKDAVDHSKCRMDRRVLLIGTSDLSDMLISMLKCVADKTVSLIAAPEKESFRFDEFGCIETEGWVDHQLPLQDDQLISASDISDQTTTVTEVISDFANLYAADQVTIGVTDESHVAPTQLELRGCGVPTYRHLGWTVGETAIGRLFALSASYLQRGTWQALAALVRHADVHAYVTKRLALQSKESHSKETVDWLVQFDQLLAGHFPIHVHQSLPPQAAKDFPCAVQVAQVIDDVLSDFIDSKQKSPTLKGIAEWSQSITKWLDQIHAGAEGLDAEGEKTRTSKSLGATRNLLNRFTELNAELDVSVSGAAAFEMLATRLGEMRVADTPKPDDVEILGWLDLALDDAPAMVVMGLNHPFVPEAVTNDPFLPGALRTQLRMSDNDRRYARDVYAMHLMLSTRTSIRFIVGQNAADGSPTPPSRLIAAAPMADSARRIRHLLNGKRPRKIIHHRWDVGTKTTQLPIPKLDASTNAVQRMSVTAFRDYLLCPYRFYLRHVLRMRPVDDATGELAANQFGDLVHGALERFGLSDDKNLTDTTKIETALFEHLHQYADDVYGDGVAMAVKLQIKQAEIRLKIVAQRQAERIAAGWVIHAAEASVDEKPTASGPGAGIEVDGKRMGLRGRFDRIDHHPETNQWAILDYKTHGHKPEKKHLQSTEDGQQWIDLQLPLYRMMIPYLGIDADPADVQLGYFNVSEKEEETRINIAQFSEPLMKSADDLIHQCIRDIWLGKFEPTNDRVQYDDYEMILQTRVPQRLLNYAELVEDFEEELS